MGAWSWPPNQIRGDSAAISRVAAAETSVQVLAANDSRLGFIVVNDDPSATLYLKYGSAASATSYTYKLGPGGTFESSPSWVYTGAIHGAWSSGASGAAQITEM